MIAVGDVLRFVAKGLLNDTEVWTWVFHQLVTSGTTETDLTVVQALRDHLDLATLLIEDDISVILASTECELYVYDFVTHQWDGTAQIGWTTFEGASVSQALANSTALLVKFFTNRGRRQARKYISGFTEAGKQGNVWLAGELAAALAWSAVLDDALVTGNVTCTPCTFNLAPASALYKTTELFNGVTAVDTISSTMRTRKPGVGI